jgi:hypothetical protein
VAKARKSPGVDVTIAGFTPAQWKQHQDTDEDWTERLDGASEAAVRDVVQALEHADATVRALACNLAYALGVAGLGDHAPAAVERLAVMAQDDKVKVRNRARIVHETLATELERTAILREHPWLSGFDPAALPQAIAALDDARPLVRLQTYLWWANASEIPSAARADALTKLAASATRETDDVARRAAEIAHAVLRGGS